MSPTATAKTELDYDVALSFAGEDRPYVREVAGIVKQAGLKVFYDEFEEASLWGKNLYTYLREIYGMRARYTVIFISQYYNVKLWTNHERESAQERAFKERSEYILPARFDDTELPGLQSTVAYIDLRSRTPRMFAEVICSKLGVTLFHHRVTSSELADAQRQFMQDLPGLVRERLPSLHRVISSRISGLFVDQVVCSLKDHLRVGREYNSEVVWRTISEPLATHFFGGKSFFGDTSGLSLFARRASASILQDSAKLALGYGEAEPFRELINALRRSSIIFETNNAHVPIESIKFLEKTASILSAIAQDNRIYIVGPFDGTGDSPDDVDLSMERAYEIRQTLIRYGVPAHMLFIKERGPYMTAVSEAMDWWVRDQILATSKGQKGNINTLLRPGTPHIKMPTETDKKIQEFLNGYIKEHGDGWVLKWVFTFGYLPNKRTFEKLKNELTSQLNTLISSGSFNEEFVLDQLKAELCRVWESESGATE